MQWTSGMTSLATAAAFVTLVGAGVLYVVGEDDPAARVTSATPSGATLPPAAGAPTTGSTSGADVDPADVAAAVPGLAVTLTARPTPTEVARPTRAPEPTPTSEPTAEPTPEPPVVHDLTISSFNVLGSSHTSGPDRRRGMASGRVRAGRAADLVRRHGSDVIGFQELQRDQLAALARQTDLDFWPGFAGSARDGENSIGWRRSEWVAVERRTVAIPYFDGHTRAMPYVRLESRTSGLEAWFANFHNPADTHRYRGQQRFRERATRIEVGLADRLVRETGLPVFVTGDMNERAPYLCAMTRGAPMQAALGGGTATCAGARPRAVDWIFGSRDVQFLGYYEDRSRLVDLTTDHPVVVARARITAPADRTADGGAD